LSPFASRTAGLVKFPSVGTKSHSLVLSVERLICPPKVQCHQIIAVRKLSSHP
jgi:hypothetical protein